MKCRWVGNWFSVVMLLSLYPAVARAQYYNGRLLGFAPYGPYTYTYKGPNGLNNNGDVVGYDSLIDGAYLYKAAGTVSSLGLSSAAGEAININGYIAVTSWGPDKHSYLYTPGRLPPWIPRFTDLGTLGGSGGLNNSGETDAFDMNDSRTIVGASTVSTTPQTTHAFSWSAGHMIDLGVVSPGGSSTANAINNLGQIVGDSFRTDGYDRAFQVVNGVMTDLDPANPNYDSSAVAINNAGQIVVVTDLAWRLAYVIGPGGARWTFVAYRGPTYYTQIYSNGVFTNIGNLGSESSAGIFGESINSAGDVVGHVYDSNHMHAFLYHAGTMMDLNNYVSNLPGWRLSKATRINDLGQIVCWAVNDGDGEVQTALLAPIFD